MQDLVTTLYNWLAISDEPQNADLIFLFGAPTLAVPQRGLELYKAGFAPYLIATGERSLTEESGWDKTLANKYAEYLIENGVDGSHIIIQNRSLNTLEDVTFSLGTLSGLERIILVNTPSIEETMLEGQLAARSVLEYEKIERYAEKGDIEKPVVSDEVREAYERLKAILG